MKKTTSTSTTNKTKETAEKLFTLKTKLMSAIDTKIDENMTRIFFVSLPLIQNKTLKTKIVIKK